SGKKEKSGNIFDAYIRQILCQITFFVDFLLNYADPKVISKLDFNRITPFPTHSFDRQGKERISDMIFLCGLKDCAGVMGVIIVFEHAGSSIFYLPKRLLQYLIGAWNIIAGNEKKKIPLPSPYFIVIRTGKKSKKKKNQPEHKQKTSDMCIQVPGLETVTGLDFDYTNVVLSEYNLEHLSGNPVTKTVLGIMKILTEGKPELFSQALAPIAGLDDYEEKRYIVNLSLELYANYLRSREQKVNEANLDHVLSPIFNPKEKQEMITTIFEDKYLEGFAEGEARGEAKMIVTVLETRFGEVPRNIVKTINSYSNPKVLESWTKRAVTCKSLKEFAEVLK
ncbi:MAG: Rpn family recombination-promoting nuclease/putative transposase, partial [Planctomycetaceae bacterium]|nr:Rpn family recombination-promoting nuclease/putative transposase [Planctomycetaceae bacterium]